MTFWFFCLISTTTVLIYYSLDELGDDQIHKIAEENTLH